MDKDVRSEWCIDEVQRHRIVVDCLALADDMVFLSELVVRAQNYIIKLHRKESTTSLQIPFENTQMRSG